MSASPADPGRYGSRHPSITEDDAEELSQVSRSILARMAEDDRRHMRAKLTLRSSPPPSSRPWWPAVSAVVTSAILAVGGSFLSMYVGGEVAKTNQAALTEKLQALRADQREHERLGMHVGSREAIATERAQIEALNERVKRIEAQLDAPSRRPR